jgi:Ca2+-binding EF-hand superfamily protein
MNKLDINRDGEVSADEILRALNTSSSFSKGSAVTQILKSLLSGSDSFPSLRDYARSLIRRFDFDSDGIITFSELCDGLASLNLSVSPADKQSLMDRLDIDRDGRITEKELYRALQSVEAPAKRLGGVNSVVDQTLKKLASGAENPKDLRGYAAKLI